MPRNSNANLLNLVATAIVATALAVATLLSGGCVTEGVPLAYSQEAFPQCHSHTVSAHRLSDVSNSNVTMLCPNPEDFTKPIQRTVAIKCRFGFGIFADTTCHENN